MKNLLLKTLFVFLTLGVIIISACEKKQVPKPPTYEVKPVYSSISEFRQGIAHVVNQIQANHITAYLDTLPNGYPNIQGRKAPLSEFGNSILSKLGGNQQQIESAVYDVFHFDGATFSLISYIMKAWMAGDISAQTVTSIAALIPLPPFPVANFQPPVEMVALALGGGDCCTDNVCSPSINILVTWTYKPACGNYEKKTSGYAANNKLSHMSSGIMYKFDAEVTGCPCPGTWTSKVETPAGASYGVSGSGKSVTVLPVSSGTYTITFSYTVCGATVTKTFTLSVG